MSDRDGPATAVRVNRVHRIGAAALGCFLWVFGIFGFFYEQVFGLSANVALSAISLVVGTVLLVSAARSGRVASTVTASVGVLFLVSGLVHLAIINTSLNLLSFRLSNIFFSLVAGVLMLGVGAYGRLVGHKPPDNPYRRRADEGTSMGPHDQELADAEQALADGIATSGQQQKAYRNAAQRQTRQYDQAWESFARDHSPHEVSALRELERRESAHPERVGRRDRPRKRPAS